MCGKKAELRFRQGDAHDEELQRGAMGTTGSGARQGSGRQRLTRGAAALALAPDLACADETGESFWTPGSFGSLAATPSQPGFSLSSTWYAPRRRPAARSRAPAPSGSDGSRPRWPKA